MAITASMVKELRERTGSGMMECKKALVETDGDIELALEHLRKTGLAKADKKSTRIAAEGVLRVAVSDGGSRAVIVEINSETDFVAKDKNFNGFADDVTQLALSSGVDSVESLMAAELSSGESVEHARQALVAKVGENVQVRRITTKAIESGYLGVYLHGNKIAVLLHCEGGDEVLAKELAMHVAAINPSHISAEDVPAAVIEKEKEILVAQANESGKPEAIIEKMVQGRLRKFLAEITLVGQPFVKDGDITVEKLLKQKGSAVISFERLALGEGVEKKEENFADEVMAQVQNA